MSIGGFSKLRLGRMREVMAGYVERGEVPGIVTLVSRRGETHVDAVGTKALAGPGTIAGGPVRRDTILRIASMAKPITPAPPPVCVDFWNSAYQAIDD
ncbi:MAG TPA: serine hydrolase [Stellaceae bacterium]|jgi:CubicO group peptidase (beta-lactamase class C family)